MSKIYPDVKRGTLSRGSSSYDTAKKPNGPKMTNPVRSITLFGVIFFVVFLIVFALFFGFESYL